MERDLSGSDLEETICYYVGYVTWLSDSRVGYISVVDDRSRQPIFSLMCSYVDSRKLIWKVLYTREMVAVVVVHT